MEKRKVNSLQSFFIMYYLLDQCYWQCQEKNESESDLDLAVLLSASSPELWEIWMPMDQAKLQDWTEAFRFTHIDKTEIQKSILAFLEYHHEEYGFSLDEAKEYVQNCTDEMIEKAVRDMSFAYENARKANSEYFREVIESEVEKQKD